MRLPAFEYFAPKDMAGVLTLLAEKGVDASVIAGGTDLLVRMKQRLLEPKFLVSLKNLKGLNYIRQEGNVTAIGAMTPLASVVASKGIMEMYPALYKAVQSIGAPAIQHFRGTVGGNLCLQTRCLYYNQSKFWRSGRGRCHKDNGEICYAEENSDRCRSANQSDGAVALMALDASIVLVSLRGKRRLPLEEFFTGRGENPFAMERDELVTEIQIPRDGGLSGFQKLTHRSAIDFCLVSAAVKIEVRNGQIGRARIAIGGAGASPLLLREAASCLEGKPLKDDAAIMEVAEKVKRHASAFMVDNLGSNLEYRKKMAGVMAKRAILEALEERDLQ